MKKGTLFAYLLGAISGLLVLGLSLFLFCPAIHVKNPGLWALVAVTLLVFAFVTRANLGHRDLIRVKISRKGGSSLKKGRVRPQPEHRYSVALYALPVVVLVVFGLAALGGSEVFNADAYARILTVTESDFATDLAESVGTDSIALMDTASAPMLGDREIGSLSDVVSQYDVSYDYTQIDYNGKPIKVSALGYAGFFKWINNSAAGAGGYVTVDPVSMSASFHRCEGMRYIPSAYLFQDARRYLWMQYPTLMMENLHFEIDEEGKPYYVASVLDKAVGLFGGKTVTGCVVLDPVTGDTVHYDLADVPRWVDVVFDGYLICDQYNWYGLYQNGFFNSLFAKKDCKQVTTYYQSEIAENEDSDDATPSADFGYIAKDGDTWIYTGITSVNGDSSNIGFLLANERTGESRYYRIAGADEKSAMAAAEGEVQEKRYQASFPSLINIDGYPTYIMVLKDSGGLVKLYATVNVEQYNLVTTAPTQAECIAKYKALLGIEGEENPADDTETVTLTIARIQYVTIEGNTYIYLADAAGNLYKAKAADHENMLLLSEGDTVELTCSGRDILTCEKIVAEAPAA